MKTNRYHQLTRHHLKSDQPGCHHQIDFLVTLQLSVALTRSSDVLVVAYAIHSIHCTVSNVQRLLMFVDCTKSVIVWFEHCTKIFIVSTLYKDYA